MEIGVAYPQIELRGDPTAVRKFGRATEDLGFAHILAYDHVLGAVHAGRNPALVGPYSERDPFHDPLVMFAYLAGITERIHFTTGILVLPQRQTALVARQATDLDLLSGGRLRLGVGVGWNFVEYEALGQDFHTRREAGGAVGTASPALHRAGCRLLGSFRPDRQGFAPAEADETDPDLARRIRREPFERAARLADGFIFFGGGTTRAIDVWKQMRDRVDSLGRTGADFGGEYVALSGADVGQLTREIEAWREAGGTHVTVVTMGLGLESVGGHIDYLTSLANSMHLH